MPSSWSDRRCLVATLAVTADPLRWLGTGEAAAGEIVASVEAGPIAPGGVARVALGGTAPARPGRYATSLRVTPDLGPAATAARVPQAAHSVASAR